MIRAICFDFDGTLARFRGDLNKLSITMFAKLGLKDFSPINLEHVRKVFRSFEYAPEAVTLESATRKTFAALGITPQGNVNEICQKFIADYAAQMQLLPNALETLSTPPPKFFIFLRFARLQTLSTVYQASAVHAVNFIS